MTMNSVVKKKIFANLTFIALNWVMVGHFEIVHVSGVVYLFITSYLLYPFSILSRNAVISYIYGLEPESAVLRSIGTECLN